MNLHFSICIFPSLCLVTIFFLSPYISFSPFGPYKEVYLSLFLSSRFGLSKDRCLSLSLSLNFSFCLSLSMYLSLLHSKVMRLFHLSLSFYFSLAEIVFSLSLSRDYCFFSDSKLISKINLFLAKKIVSGG